MKQISIAVVISLVLSLAIQQVIHPSSKPESHKPDVVRAEIPAADKIWSEVNFDSLKIHDAPPLPRKSLATKPVHKRKPQIQKVLNGTDLVIQSEVGQSEMHGTYGTVPIDYHFSELGSPVTRYLDCVTVVESEIPFNSGWCKNSRGVEYHVLKVEDQAK